MDETAKEPLSHRLGRAFRDAKDSDFYSRDGQTWDETADGIEFFQRSYQFKLKLVKDAQVVDTGSTSDMNRASKELKSLLSRVEARAQEGIEE